MTTYIVWGVGDAQWSAIREAEIAGQDAFGQVARIDHRMGYLFEDAANTGTVFPWVVELELENDDELDAQTRFDESVYGYAQKEEHGRGEAQSPETEDHPELG